MPLDQSWADAFGWWVLGDVVLSCVAAVLLRAHFDKDGSGKIERDEAYTAGWHVGGREQRRPKLGGTLYDMAPANVLQILIEAFSFSAAYGFLAVKTFDRFFQPGDIEPRFAYLLLTALVLCSLFFMCGFATHHVHLLTGHRTHFIYYLLGFLPILTSDHLPAWPERGLAVAYILIRVLLYFALRVYAQPGYPMFYELVNTYTIRSDGEVAVATTPHAHESWVNEAGETVETTRVSDFFPLAVAFPVYEILNGHFTSSLTFGILVGALTKEAGVDPYWAPLVALLVAGLYISPLCDRMYWGFKWDSIRRYYPRLWVLAAMPIGAALAALQDRGGVIWHGLHLGTTVFAFGYSFLATRYGSAWRPTAEQDLEAAQKPAASPSQRGLVAARVLSAVAGGSHVRLSALFAGAPEGAPQPAARGPVAFVVGGVAG